MKNLIVPVSGDFGGPQAIRAIGAWLKSRGGTVSAYYVSNVEQYLFQDGKATRVLPERRDAAAERRERVHPPVLDAESRLARRGAVAVRDRGVPRRRGGRARLLELRRARLRQVTRLVQGSGSRFSVQRSRGSVQRFTVLTRTLNRTL